MLGLKRVLDADALQDFGCKIGQARKAPNPAFGQGIPDAQHAVIGNTYDIAAIGIFGQFAI